MRLLYLSYWGLDESLVHSTVYPHLQILQVSERIERLVFVSVERKEGTRFLPGFDAPRILHVPLRGQLWRPTVLARTLDFLQMPVALATLCRKHAITFVLAKGATAGSLAHLMQRHGAVAYAVESFEPHALYMLESGVWSFWDPRYVFQQRWEDAQKRGATMLLPVSDAYRDALVAEGVPQTRVITLPCTVDTERFRFSPALRREFRTRLLAPDDTVIGVYVGKFGDIYYDREAFDVFARFAERLAEFRMVVLTPTAHSEVQRLARDARFPLDRLFVTEAPHAEIPGYLSAADVGFATYKMAPSRRFFSPVKVGEYWACGLPVVITRGVGDDSEIIQAHDAGAVIDYRDRDQSEAIERVVRILAEPNSRDRIAVLAGRFRSRSRVRSAYEQMGLL